MQGRKEHHRAREFAPGLSPVCRPGLFSAAEALGYKNAEASGEVRFEPPRDAGWTPRILRIFSLPRSNGHAGHAQAQGDEELENKLRLHFAGLHQGAQELSEQHVAQLDSLVEPEERQDHDDIDGLEGQKLQGLHVPSAEPVHAAQPAGKLDVCRGAKQRLCIGGPARRLGHPCQVDANVHQLTIIRMIHLLPFVVPLTLFIILSLFCIIRLFFSRFHLYFPVPLRVLVRNERKDE